MAIKRFAWHTHTNTRRPQKYGMEIARNWAELSVGPILCDFPRFSAPSNPSTTQPINLPSKPMFFKTLPAARTRQMPIVRQSLAAYNFYNWNN